MTKHLFGLFVQIIMIALLGCVSEQRTADSDAVDIEAEIAMLDTKISQGREQGLDLLSPRWFLKTQNSFIEAKGLEHRQAPTKEIMDKVKQGHEALQIAAQFGEMAKKILGDVLQARTETWMKMETAKKNNPTAFAGMANRYAGTEKNFFRLTDAVENNLIDWAKFSQQEVAKQYQDIGRALMVGSRTAVVMPTPGITPSQPTPMEPTQPMPAPAMPPTQQTPPVPQPTTVAVAKQPPSVSTTQGVVPPGYETQYKKVRELFDGEETSVLLDGNDVVLRLMAVTFPVGKSELSSRSFPVLAKVKKAIKILGDPPVTVEGHTDSTGSAQFNEQLSEDRAASVKEYLVSSHGVAEHRVFIAGLGFSRPLVAENTREGRAINRRIDVILHLETSNSD